MRLTETELARLHKYTETDPIGRGATAYAETSPASKLGLDAVGTAEVIQGLDTEKIELFPEISIGDAPGPKGKKG